MITDMAIHFENYRTFSKGQGFIGSACRPISPQAKSARWKAVDCRECKNTLVGRVVISRDMSTGAIESIDVYGVSIVMSATGEFARVPWDAFDDKWAPMPSMEELFGDGAS